jgi:hypothetical protein
MFDSYIKPPSLLGCPPLENIKIYCHPIKLIAAADEF